MFRVFRPSSRSISTHALREEGDAANAAEIAKHAISTHALREEGDLTCSHYSIPSKRISTHALREEGDSLHLSTGIEIVPFLPTPSARRATGLQNIATLANVISTHALREEGDGTGVTQQGLLCGFLPTPSARRATVFRYQLRAAFANISTHALREEGDSKCAGK